MTENADVEKCDRLEIEHKLLVGKFVDVKLLCSHLKAENKALKSLLDTAEQIIVQLRKEAEEL